MKKTITVREAITRALKSHGALKPKDLIAKTGRPANQVYTTVYKMVKDKYLSKSSTGHIVIAGAPALTAIKPDLPIAIDTIETIDLPKISDLVGSVTKRKSTGLEMSMGKKISILEKEVDSLKRELTQMSVNYYDALAVVKYLESKIKV